jgi:integrase
MTLYTRSPKAGATWYAEERVNGVREKHCTGTSDKAEAKKIADKHFAGVLLGVETPNKSKRSQRLDMEQLEASYKVFAADIDESTRRVNMNSLKAVRKETGIDDPSIISPETWVSYKAIKLEGKYGEEKASALRSLKSNETKIRSLFRKDIRPLYGNLPEKLVAFLSQPKTKAPPVSYTLPPKALIDATWEQSKELAVLAPKAHAAFVMAVTGGLRVGEILGYKQAWVNGCDYKLIPAEPVLTIPGSENLFQTKSRKSRTIPLGKAFLESACEGITESDIRTLNKWMKDKVGWTTQKGAHELRKLYGAQVATGYGLYVAQRLLGHSDPSVTAAYYADLCEVPRVAVRES